MKRRQTLSRRELLGAASAGFAASLEAKTARPQSFAQSPARKDIDADLAKLREIFLNPPASAKPMTRWWWFGGAVTPGEISRELELMRAAGLRGVELQPVYPLEVDDPARGVRNVAYFSQEWFDLLRHTAREARRLGLQFDFTLGSGWPYGGPFIPTKLSARRLRVLSQDAAGISEFTWNLAPHLVAEETLVAVVAAPVLPSQQPDLRHTQVITDQIKEITSNNLRVGMGLYQWQVPAGEWRIMVFIDSPTGMQVKRPTVGMEGAVLDHFSREAMELFLRAAGDRTFEELKPLGIPAIDSIFCDSLEVYGADWTPKFMEEFEKRRGYSLTPYLPALWQDAGPLTPHVRYDYHLPLSDLILENFFLPLTAWSEKNGVRARIQAHGAFGDIIEGYAAAHIPEGENIFLGDRYQVNLRHRKLASSAAHLYSKPVASAETYTWLRMPLFLTTLEMMKAATDATFLDGINQVVNHGYPFSPPEGGEPGRVFYASTLINHTNLWWRHYPHLAKYIQRTAAILLQGVSVNPIAVYLPLADVFAKFGLGALHIDEELENQIGTEPLLKLRRLGQDFDLINDSALLNHSEVVDGKLRIGGASYVTVIVPGARFMSPESLEKLANFVAQGGILHFVDRVPEAAPGVQEQESRTKRLHRTLEKLFGTPQPPKDASVTYKRGSAGLVSGILDGVEDLWPDFTIMEAGSIRLPETFSGLGGVPDFLAGGPEMEFARENVGFIHRRFGTVDLYFVSNLAARTQDLRVQFQIGNRTPQRWNPEDASIQENLVFEFGEYIKGEVEVTEVQLRLEPFESCFIVFGNSNEEPTITRSNVWGPLRIERGGKQNLIKGLAEESGDLWLETRRGKRHRIAVKGTPGPVRLEGPWTLKLGERPPIELGALRSWNELPEGKTYSGWGTYKTSFDLADFGVDIEWAIVLGRVHETAEAELNGVLLGAAWKGTRRLACGSALMIGKNYLTVRVANLWIHHMQSRPKPDLTALEETYGIRWGRYGEVEAKEIPPSGLLGPVRLVPSKRWTLKI